MMKKLFAILTAALILAALALPGVSLAEGASPRTVTVNGTATVSVPASFAVVSLAVETSAKGVSEAAAENAARVEAVLSALKAAGIDEKDIVTERFYVNTLYDYSVYDPAEGSRIQGYQVTNGLSVTVRGIDDVGRVIDVAIQAGANACNGIFFRTEQAAQANDDALAAAVAEGRRKAELMAKAAGATLGELLAINEASGSYGGVMLAKSAAADGAARSTQIIADGLDYTATVSMTFALQ